MSRAVKAGLLGLVIAATVWAITLWQWRRAPESVSGQHILLQLIGLPLVLTLVALLAWSVATRLRERLAFAPVTDLPARAGHSAALQVASQTGRDAVAAGAGLTSEGPAEVAQAVALVLAEALCLPAGANAASAWCAVRDAEVRPVLDPELVDADGLPVFTGRVPDLDLTDWRMAHADVTPAGGGAPLPDGVVRVLALLEAPLHALMEAVGHWPQAGGVTAQDPLVEPEAGLPVGAPSHLSGVGRPDGRARRQAQSERTPAVEVRLCLPSDWSAHNHARAVAWVRAQCGALLDWTEAHGAAPPHWQEGAWPDRLGPEALWAELSDRWPRWSASARPQLLLLLAADSAVDADQVAKWQARGELFTSHHQGGRVPGEGAAGLWLANPAWQAWAHAAGQSDVPDASPWLWPSERCARERSADAVGRADASGLQRMLQTVADRLAPHAQGDWTLVSDGDHRASRTAEVFEALLAVRPQVDPMLSVLRAGDACGDMGLARALVPVALAAAALRGGDAAGLTLSLSVQDALQRVVVPLTPAADKPPRAHPPDNA